MSGWLQALQDAVFVLHASALRCVARVAPKQFPTGSEAVPKQIPNMHKVPEQLPSSIRAGSSQTAPE
eukprot:4092914-Lingulodinium_polyedra.AAC.1